MVWPVGTRVLRTPKGLAYARGIIGHGQSGPSLNLVLCHGVGHHKEVAWAPMLPHLARLLDAEAVSFIAPDFSGHGESRIAPDGQKWDAGHCDDISEVLQDAQLDSTLPCVGVGVSMGGAVLCAHELRRPGTFSHVTAIEPPLFTRVAAAVARTVSDVGANWMADKASRRRSRWPSFEAARAHISSRGGKHWTPEAREAFVKHGGLREADDGTVSLVCHPRTEGSSMMWPGEPLPNLAHSYRGSASFTIVACSASQFSPIGIPGTGVPFYRTLIAPAFPSGGARFRVLGEGATHSIGQEQPELLARAVDEDLRQRGLL